MHFGGESKVFRGTENIVIELAVFYHNMCINIWIRGIMITFSQYVDYNQSHSGKKVTHH